MRVRLDTLGDVPGEAVAVDEIVHGAEGDVDIIADPRSAEEDEDECDEKNKGENFLGAGHERRKFITADAA